MPEPAIPSSRPRVLSGMRPTGKLHLGNYMGALANWVKLQDDQYECYFFIADLHALTTDYADPSSIAPNTLEVALDFLAAGLDPERSTIFVQSQVKQHYELPLLLGMITPLGWLERVPSYKEMQENLETKDLTTYGFLGYPVLMASDILLYQPEFVPVGQDQQAHVELTREIARRFNQFYKAPKRDQECSPRAPGPAHAFAQAARHRRPQDVQELRQHHPVDRSRSRWSARSSRPWSLTRPASAAPTPAIPTSARSAICIRSFPRRKPWQRSMMAAGPPASAASNAKAGPPTPWSRSCSPSRSAALLSPSQRQLKFLKTDPAAHRPAPSKPWSRCAPPCS